MAFSDFLSSFLLVSAATSVGVISKPTGPAALTGSLPPAGLGTSGFLGSSFGGSSFFGGDGGGGSSFLGGVGITTGSGFF